jgi:glutamine amidotransferase
MPGRCRRFEDRITQEDGTPAPVPHMGWNSLRARATSPLLAGIDPLAEFYFVHSYYADTAPELVIATTVYGREFCSVYGRGGLWAVQFHPEKSGGPGLTLLRNFYAYCREAAHAQ